MNYLLLKSKKMLAILSGIIFVGITLHTVSQRMPVASVQANLTENVNIATVNTEANNIVEEINVKEVKLAAQYTPNNEKVDRIRTYLQKRNSPLAQYAEEFVKAADHYGIDYRIVAAISVVESGGGKSNFKPYNAWGWGKSGFANWTEGIWKVSEGIGKYYAKGLVTPQAISKSYCPPSAVAWARKVNYVMSQIAS